MELQFQLANLITFISLSITTFHEKQRKFLEALVVGSQSHSQTPMILPPGVLIQELKNIKEKLNKNSDLPLPINQDTISNFYQIAVSRSRIINDQLIVQMSIPLVLTKTYELIKLTSFPYRLQTNAFSFILPTPEYVAIDNLREHFIPMNQNEINNCLKLTHHTKHPEIICNLLSPILSTKSEDCTVNLLTRKHNSQNCDIRVSNITQETWIKLHQVNTWIGVFPSNQVIYTKCDGFPTSEHRLIGTGIIKIIEDCQIKTNDIWIQAQKVYSSDIYSRPQPIIRYDSAFNSTILKLNSSILHDIKRLDYPSVITLGESNKLSKISTAHCSFNTFNTLIAMAHPSYKKRPNRLKSFQAAPRILQDKLQSLLNAGFYYTQHSDLVQCFKCHATLSDWHINSKPHTEHQRVSPNCPLVLKYSMKTRNASLLIDFSTHVAPKFTSEYYFQAVHRMQYHLSYPYSDMPDKQIDQQAKYFWTYVMPAQNSLLLPQELHTNGFWNFTSVGTQPRKNPKTTTHTIYAQ
ncbi:hypothetical protein HA402_009376 [Bradysia odoriphaga]|nr:hypothetical protein HA402_009376 [Bradysia odoriphaga]